MTDSLNQQAKPLDGERIDAYIRLADACWKDADARRVYEWRISLGLWTALAAFAALMLRGEAHPPCSVKVPASLLLIAIDCVYVFPWTKGLRERQKRSLKTAHQFWDLAENELGTESARKEAGKDKKAKLQDKCLLYHWSHGSQIFITWALTAVALISMWVVARK